MSRTRAPQGSPLPPSTEARLGALRRDIADTLRAGRARLGQSQRELAASTGYSQSVIARLETEAGDPRVSCLVAVLATVDAGLVLPHAAQLPPLPAEHVRDDAGRRLPAHLKPYRRKTPHSWWPWYTRADLWPFAPTWSYWRRPFPGDDDWVPAKLRRPLPPPPGGSEPPASPGPCES